jgi:pentatricopeptide repeat protein
LGFCSIESIKLLVGFIQTKLFWNLKSGAGNR